MRFESVGLVGFGVGGSGQQTIWSRSLYPHIVGSSILKYSCKTTGQSSIERQIPAAPDRATWHWSFTFCWPRHKVNKTLNKIVTLFIIPVTKTCITNNQYLCGDFLTLELNKLDSRANNARMRLLHRSTRNWSIERCTEKAQVRRALQIHERNTQLRNHHYWMRFD